MFYFLDKIPELLGNAAQTEFVRTAAIFGLAAHIHAKQVRKEIKTQLGELVAVLKQDLDAQKAAFLSLTSRVDKIEKNLSNIAQQK